MARPRNPAIALRNEQVYAFWKSGKSLTWLAEKYDRTPQQMGRVIAAFHPDLDEDDDRALHRGRLEALYEEVQGIIASPGVKLAPNGRLAEDYDGNPIEDMQAKIEAAGLQLKVLESMRKLDARDRPPKKGTNDDEARQQLEAFFAELAAKKSADERELAELRRRVAVIPGQVEKPAIEG